MRVSWKREQLPKETLLESFPQQFAEDDDNGCEPLLRQTMERCLRTHLAFTQGRLELRDYALNPPYVHRLVIEILPRVQTMIRSLIVCLNDLEDDGGDEDTTLQTVVNVCATAPCLRHVKITGKREAATHLAKLLSGLAKNPSKKLISLSLHRFHAMETQEPQSRDMDLIRQALAQLSSLREVEMVWCSAAAVEIVCQGLRGHAKLQKVVMDGARPFHDDPGIASFLASLQNIQHVEMNRLTAALVESLIQQHAFQCVQQLVLSFDNDADEDAIARLLKTTNTLQSLQLVDLNFLELALPSLLPCLQALDVKYLHNLQSITLAPQRTALRHLTVRRPVTGLEAALTEASTLTHLCLYNQQWNDGQVGHLFHLLQEKNHHLQSISFDSIAPNASEETARQLQTMLSTTETLKTLQLCAQDAILNELTHVLRENRISLERLALTRIQSDMTALVQSLPHNNTLTSLFLSFESPMTPQAWNVWKPLMDAVRENKTLKTLNLEMNTNSNVNVDDLGMTLAKNQTLTQVSVRNNPSTQVKLDFVCRLYTRRNRIRHMAQSDKGAVAAALWPTVLESCLAPNPSLVFLAMDYVVASLFAND